MELVTLKIGHFKNLNQVSFDFCPSVNLLTGRSSSGKAELIQALEMMSCLALGNTRGFFRENPIEQDTQRPLLKVEVVFRADGRFWAWEHHFHVPDHKLVFEKIREGPALESMKDLLVYENGTLWLPEGKRVAKRNLKGAIFRDSVLDWVKPGGFPSFSAFRKRIRHWAEGFHYLGELNPHFLAKTSTHRSPTFWKHGDGFTGFLAGLRPHRRQRVLARMQRYFPGFTSIKPKVQPGRVAVEYREESIYRPLSQLSNKQRCLLAFSTIPELSASLLVLEAPENSVYPEALPTLFGDLNAAPFQILATTDSMEDLPFGRVLTIPGNN